MWVRGLKHSVRYGSTSKATSHPMWVRGLKLLQRTPNTFSNSRTLCGCVD